MRRLFAALLLLAPLAAFAHDVPPIERAGTDDYLRDEAGFTDADLSFSVVTEKREAFLLSHETESAADPLGDVLTRNGTSSKMHVPWGDLQSADASKNTDGSWTFRVVSAADIPESPSHQAQFLLLVDRDGKPENNDLSGIHGNMDAEFAVTRTENGWKTGFRWFNKDADFWAIDQKTTATFVLEKNVFSLTIPEAELPHGASSWRMMLALANGGDTQIDAVPGVGFPKPTEAEKETPASQVTKPSIALYGIPFVIVGLGLIWFGWKRRT